MSKEAVRVIYAAETSQGRIFLGFSDASFCTVSLEELQFAGIFQSDLDSIGFTPKAAAARSQSAQAAV